MTNKRVTKAIKALIKDLPEQTPDTYLITREDLLFFAGQLYGLGQGQEGKIATPNIAALVEEIGWYGTERAYTDEYVIKRTIEATIEANKNPTKNPH